MGNNNDDNREICTLRLRLVLRLSCDKLFKHVDWLQNRQFLEVEKSDRSRGSARKNVGNARKTFRPIQNIGPIVPLSPYIEMASNAIRATWTVKMAVIDFTASHMQL
ncbi:PREDICTED: uncharacterized protein LOC105561691 [Vollenhovia emeryi]|uniref:uncharacterized protein LOC105561691 n=1 Tax=Vollenhovia emeryi TaxID=411798 RepID=UPI0005F50624|nr:PREDICTED: uncharacterized protein LOC105561691 [Vollenhovia emeryi]